MAKKKTEYTPKLIFYADRIKLHMGFLSDSQLGCLIRMLTFHAVGMDAEADKLLKSCADNVIKMLYADHRQYMDADNARYKERCEKNRQIALEREERKRNETNVHERTQSLSNTKSNTNTNTKSNTKSFNKDNIPTPTRAGRDGVEEVMIEEAFRNESWQETIRMKYKLTPTAFLEKWQEFLVDCKANSKEHDSINDVQSHFNCWLGAKHKNNGRTNSSNRNSDDAERRRQGYADTLNQLIADCDEP